MRIPLTLGWGSVNCVIDSLGQITALEGRCRDGTEFSVQATSHQVWRWISNGEYIQDVFPELTPDEREMLISGTSPEAFAAMFPEEEEEP